MEKPALQDTETCLWTLNEWRQETIKSGLSVNYRACHTWLLVYLVPRFILKSKSEHRNEFHIKKVVYLHLDLCQSAVQKKKKEKRQFLTKTNIYDKTKQIKMLHWAINMLVLSKHTDCVWSRQDVVTKGNSQPYKEDLYLLFVCLFVCFLSWSTQLFTSLTDQLTADRD